jgi:putative FmdB family regulatory protein
MPIYEYRCGRCAHEFEVWQKISDPPIKVCPKCRAHKVEKMISLTSFQLKGTGWYATDYAKSGSSSGSSKGAKSESSSTESKPSTEKKTGDSGKSEKSGGDKAGDKGSKAAGDGGGATPRLAAAAA